MECVIAVPTMHIGVLDHPGLAATDVSSVRLLFTGGAVVPPALVKRVEAAFGAPMCIVFAQTEASPVITETAPGDATADRVRTASERAADGTSPPSDLSGQADYRMHLARVLTRRAVSAAAGI